MDTSANDAMEPAHAADRPAPATATVALAQGALWAATGLWPILRLRSFTHVTDPKLEGWLVKTVGALIAVVGGTLISAGARQRITEIVCAPVRYVARWDTSRRVCGAPSQRTLQFE